MNTGSIAVFFVIVYEMPKPVVYLFISRNSSDLMYACMYRGIVGGVSGDGNSGVA
jgi:hypothetical protein